MRIFFLLWLSQLCALAVNSPLILRSQLPESNKGPKVESIKLHLDNLAFQKPNSEWIQIPSPPLTITQEEQRITLPNVPIGTFKAIQFSVLQPKTLPALSLQFSNTNLSLDNHPFPPRIHLSSWFVIQEQTPLTLTLDLGRLLQFPRAIPLDGSLSQRSMNSAFIANLHSSFSFTADTTLLPPLHLPKIHTPVTLSLPPHFAPPALPPDNPLSQERIDLGEQLFFDGILSADGSVTCSACHSEENAFAEDRAISRGFEGRLGKANSMPLFNRAWKSSFFWNGRAPSIRAQVLSPIAHRQEMALPVQHALVRINRRRDYQRQFSKAFGPGKITRDKLALALESFILSLTSFDSKFDRAMQGKATLSPAEQRGMDLFYNDHIPGKPSHGAGCYHCHGGSNFTDHQFHNNGIFSPKDDGLQEFSGQKEDLKKFITPSLRNIVQTKPYAHDGRLLTLAEVIDHYSNPPHLSDTLDPRLPKEGLQLSEKDKTSLIAFLKTLSDPKY